MKSILKAMLWIADRVHRTAIDKAGKELIKNGESDHYHGLIKAIRGLDESMKEARKLLKE